jgi:hypothetical protein
MCVCIIEFVVVLFKMLSCITLYVVSGTCLFADCSWYLVNALMMTSYVETCRRGVCLIKK